MDRIGRISRLFRLAVRQCVANEIVMVVGGIGRRQRHGHGQPFLDGRAVGDEVPVAEAPGNENGGPFFHSGNRVGEIAQRGFEAEALVLRLVDRVDEEPAVRVILGSPAFIAGQILRADRILEARAGDVLYGSTAGKRPACDLGAPLRLELE
ncbi:MULTISPECIES: hypothetical protein [Pacificimonas]|uniref:Uncharacterized protein n=1 Tax=Pacificimonas aurantium TaxID=1250540 RepID=A0ABS7WNW2_9SPHN|nr:MULTISPECIES: hypothetical protein [Pacificimonas]MBZ6380091.1 hypothetical protein [Pacificimonas aurantium]